MINLLNIISLIIRETDRGRVHARCPGVPLASATPLCRSVIRPSYEGRRLSRGKIRLSFDGTALCGHRRRFELNGATNKIVGTLFERQRARRAIRSSYAHPCRPAGTF